MADPSVFKLFRTVDPSTVNVPIKDKFSKLTLSSNKKKQLEKPNEPIAKCSSASRDLLTELSDHTQNKPTKTTLQSYENPLMRSDSSSSVVIMGVEHDTPKSSQADVSDYMDALQISSDGFTQQQEQQQALDQDVEQLSTQVSNLTMQRKTVQPNSCVDKLSTQVSNLTIQQPKQQQEVSICISSTTEEDDENSCITISDTSGSECDPQLKEDQLVVEESMEVSEHQIRSVGELLGVPSTIDKVERIQAFLRDVSYENHEMQRRGLAEHSHIASADTMSMSQDVDVTQLSASQSRPLDSSKLLADNETEVNSTVWSEEQSKRLADNETELNTMCSEEQEQEENSSRRLAHNDTEVNTPDIDQEEPLSELSTLNDVDPNESVTIPETCSEAEQSPVRPRSATSSTEGSELGTPAIQVSSINISAKINIKIHIPTMDSSSGTESDGDANDNPPEEQEQEEQEQDKQEQQRQQKNRSILTVTEDASEDQEFLANAEQLLNQLYGKAWQTPDVIRTLKRSSGSGNKLPIAPTPTVERTPLTEIRRQPRARRPAATTARKRIPPAPTNESALGDFSLFKRDAKLNSTHLPRSERAVNKRQVRTNHVHEDRWRALIDSDSGTDASDDEDADATISSDSSDVNDDGHLTYLDLTKDQVEVVSSPDSPAKQKSPGFPKKLDDILRTCRATEKPKLVASPSTPMITKPARRQLFTPNTGYEDDQAAKKIVEQAIDLDSLDQLEIVYLPGTNVHKRVQEVKKQLGIAIESPKAKPVFKLPTPQATPNPTIPKSMDRKKNKVQVPRIINPSDKYGFIKSLDTNLKEELCDKEAYFYRENFKRNKEELATKLYNLFNAEVFDNKLEVPVTWSKLLRNTAGRCKNKQKLGQRMSVVELSVKVLTSADRLRCTLIHELCHAAAWVFNGEGGHGRTWKMWAQQAMNAFPDLPQIKVCHSYNIEFKYTYRCDDCNIQSYAHSRSVKAESIRCSKCKGPITLHLNKKDKQGNIVATPVRQATGFAKYVKDNFQKHKKDHLTAADVMRILSAEYAKEKNKNQGSNAETHISKQVETLVIN